MFKDKKSKLENFATLRKYAIVAMCSLALVAAVGLSGCAAPASDVETDTGSANQKAELLSVEVSVTSAAANAKDSKWPANLVNAELVEVKSGSSVLDVLDSAKIEYKLDGVYVTEIEGLSQKAIGSGSGWLYTVNGESPLDGPGAIEVHDGDKIVFDYFVG